jgi:hypothetical protein
MRPSGIFLTHERNRRIRAHFDRLVAESGSLVDWHFVFNPDSGAHPVAPFGYEDPATVMAGRYGAMLRNGGVIGGYLDTLFVPLLRALPGEHLWVMEYDVDYSGSWADFFGQFTDNDADLLTTSLAHRSESPRWDHWKRATAPSWVSPESFVRALHPLMRVSRDLVTGYPVAMADPGWRGHYEFTLTTTAVVGGARVEDLGGDGTFTPPDRVNRNYVGKTSDRKTPGHTFGFRPVRRRYFHESPQNFDKPGQLYHPIKPGVAAWSRQTKNARPPAALASRRTDEDGA